MRSWLPFLLSITTFATASLHAESALNLYGAGSEVENPIVTPEAPGRPFFISTEFEGIASAHFDHRHFKKQKIGYTAGELAAGGVIFYNACKQEAINVSLSYWHDHIEWKHNRYFDHHSFDNVTLSVGFFSMRVHDWFWRGQVGIDVDATYGDFWRYTFYDLLLWGRYTCSPTLGFHVGFVGQTGQRLDHVYPLIGLDWAISDRWKLNAVFPVEISLEYTLTQRWSFALATRFFEIRHRLRQSDRLKRGLIEYKNTGLELGCNYVYGKAINVNLHVGEALGGYFKLESQRHRRIHRLEFKPSPYAGGELQFHF